MDEKDLNMTNEQLLDSLGLIKDGKILRAGMMPFHQNPEKWINGAYIKIGYFESDSEISYMNEIHSSLISQADKVIDLIFTKYLKVDISYEGVTRIETYPFPKAAIREAVYNAIVHKNYATQIPIQISIYKDKLYISNDCILPSGWTVETLMGKHRSKPFNPNIANGFFRAGFIETWGRSIKKICEACKNYGTVLPEYTIYPEDIMIKFEALNATKNAANGSKNKIEENSFVVFEFLRQYPKTTYKNIIENLNISRRTLERIISLLKENGYIERVGNNRSGYWKILKKEIK